MFDTLAKEVLSNVEHVLGDIGVNADAKSEKLRAIIEAQLAKLNLVPRQEFDAQCAVLARTRAKLDELEKQLADIEAATKKQ